MNIYAYVGGDPVNYNDPLGLDECQPGEDCITITRRRLTRPVSGPEPFPTTFWTITVPLFYFVDADGRRVAGERKEEHACNQGMVDLANKIASAAEGAGDASEIMGVMGGGTLTASLFMGPAAPEVAAVGTTLLAGSGVAGVTSIGLDIGAASIGGYATGNWEGAVRELVRFAIGHGMDRAVISIEHRYAPGASQAWAAANGVAGFDPASRPESYSCDE